jgi:acyl-CoA synthetase (AMP-forming)/AMP-acid ligase II
MRETMRDLLSRGGGDAVAIAAPGAAPLRFAALRALMDEMAGGIGRSGRIAIVLPNGPELACAFLSIAACASAAPLNPAYRAEEFEFYLSDLKARALLVEAGSDSPAIAVARKLNMPVIRLHAAREKGAGNFTLDISELDGAPAHDTGDEALVLHTSGTTSRPKIVPLTQSNIAASARNIVATLNLSEHDRGLTVMPLFHIHGLMAGLIAPLAAGGSVFCAGSFNALKFFAWMEEAKPTWYTAVPTMHQAILSRARRHEALIAANRLRFIRSSSAPLLRRVQAELERTFGAPAIESYGMTEACHQMSSNPLPPGTRKPGTVGIASGPAIAIMDREGNLLKSGETGEIVIRGDNVTLGYGGNANANAEAFTNGWFRTGDLGVMDEDGYITINGRLKEIINRGGEKISPREVDEVLMDHPAVQQAVVFAIPHDRLGEDLGAAVVLHDGERISERDLRAFAALRLADFKVPRRIMFLEDIPKGPTGKLQRIGLAQKLGL